jgi:hypothetical protein
VIPLAVIIVGTIGAAFAHEHAADPDGENHVQEQVPHHRDRQRGNAGRRDARRTAAPSDRRRVNIDDDETVSSSAGAAPPAPAESETKPDAGEPAQE